MDRDLFGRLHCDRDMYTLREKQNYLRVDVEVVFYPHSEKCFGSPRNNISNCWFVVVVVVIVVVFISKTVPVYAQYLRMPEPVQLMRAPTVAIGQLPKKGTRFSKSIPEM